MGGRGWEVEDRREDGWERMGGGEDMWERMEERGWLGKDGRRKRGEEGLEGEGESS